LKKIFKALAQAKAWPSQALLQGFGFGFGNVKPKPDEAKPKPWLQSQAKPEESF
jgi:hypothetical protein